MRWLKSREKLLQKKQSTISPQERISYYYSSLEKDTKDLERLRESLNLKNHLFEELRELVERCY